MVEAFHVNPHWITAITFGSAIARSAALKTVPVTNSNVDRNKLPLLCDRADLALIRHDLEVTDIRGAEPAYNANLSAMRTMSDARHETGVFAE